VFTSDAQTLTNKTISGSDNTVTNISLTTGVTGTLPVANGGTGQTSYTNGQLLIGNTTGNTLTKATLTAGDNITITNGAGSITIASTGGGAGAWVEISRATASNSATIDFTGLNTDYDEYMVQLYNVAIGDPPSPEISDELYMRTSSDNGTSYDSGASDYATNYASGGGNVSGSGDAIYLAYTEEDTSSGGGASFSIVFVRPATTGQYATGYLTGASSEVFPVNDYSVISVNAAFARLSTSGVNAIRFQLIHSNILSGIFVLLGRKK
jgi:hypothetical protein